MTLLLGLFTRSPSSWCPFTVSFWGREPLLTKIDYRKKGTLSSLILTSLLDLVTGTMDAACGLFF